MNDEFEMSAADVDMLDFYNWLIRVGLGAMAISVLGIARLVGFL